MTWEAILLAVLGGLAGVVIGAIITLKRDQQHEARLDQGAARATFFEVSQNSASLEMIGEHGRRFPLFTSTWLQNQSRLASKLSPEDLAIVATMYMKIEAMRLRLDDVSELAALSGNVVTSARGLVNRTDQAAEILQRAGWPNEQDQARLLQQLASHVESDDPNTVEPPRPSIT